MLGNLWIFFMLLKVVIRALILYLLKFSFSFKENNIFVLVFCKICAQTKVNQYNLDVSVEEAFSLAFFALNCFLYYVGLYILWYSVK